eukprot:7379628-Prymnesium_polylepis.5
MVSFALKDTREVEFPDCSEQRQPAECSLELSARRLLRSPSQSTESSATWSSSTSCSLASWMAMVTADASRFVEIAAAASSSLAAATGCSGCCNLTERTPWLELGPCGQEGGTLTGCCPRLRSQRVAASCQCCSEKRAVTQPSLRMVWTRRSGRRCDRRRPPAATCQMRRAWPSRWGSPYRTSAASGSPGRSACRTYFSRTGDRRVGRLVVTSARLRWEAAAEPKPASAEEWPPATA